MAKSGSAAPSKTKPAAMQVHVKKAAASRPAAKKPVAKKAVGEARREPGGGSFDLSLRKIKHRSKALSSDIKSLLERLS
jgi:hypothetical protein